MRFTHPSYLLLLLPIFAGLFLSWRQVHGMAKGRKRLSFAIRAALVGCLVLALAGPEARRANEGLCTIFLLDRSDSISDEDRKAAEKFVDEAMRQLGPNDLAGVVAFGKDALVDSAPGGRRELGQVQSVVDGSSSDLAAAVRLASASFPDGKSRRVVVLSDGNETSGDLSEAAQVAATDGIPIDFVPLGEKERRGEVAVVGIEAPTESRADQPFDLRVLIDSTREQSAVVELDKDGVLLKRIPVSLTPGRNSVVVAEKVRNVGFHRYRATVRADADGDNRNNVGLGFVAVRGKPKLLVLQQNLEDRTLVDALRKSGLEADLAGTAGIPVKPEQYQQYEGVILNDINAQFFTSGQMRQLQAATRDSGVGLAMIGGENSFLPGGWYGTSVAEALPVDLNIRQRKTFPSTSIAIMVDASGSMGMVEDGHQKIRLAAMAAEQTVRLMSPMDRIAVAGCTDGIEFVAPMQKLTDKAAVINQIRKLSVGGGGIYMRPSMEKAEQVLMKENSKVRHHIMLADGSDADDQGGTIEIALRMRMNKITTSVVALGDGPHVPYLKKLAAAGGGRFYLVKKAGQLPAIFTQDTALMSRSAIEEGAFTPKISAGEEILRGVAEDGLPPLLAYCLADSRPLSRVGMRTQKDDPLLATWQYGLGTSLAFMSDAQPRWASRWVGWPGFDTFWAQASRAIARRATLNNYQVDVRHDGGKGVVDVSAFDTLGNPMTVSEASVRVAVPSGGYREVLLSQEAPGKYRGSFDATEIGTYIVTVSEKDAGGASRSTATGFSLPYPPEYRSFRANRPLLERAAASTSGQALEKPSDALRPVPNPGESIRELWAMFVLAAAILLPIDIGVRRVALPLGELLAKAWARLSHRESNTAPTQEAVGRLQQAKKRAKVEGGTTPQAVLDTDLGASKVRTPGEPVAPRSSSTQAEASNSSSSGKENPSENRVPGEGETVAKSLLEKKRQRK